MDVTVRERARELWALGDYGRIARLIADMGRDLVAAAGVGPGRRVLDVAAGTGNATLPAAAAGAEVVAVDLTPELVAAGETAARDAGLEVDWHVGDAECLPFPDRAFDVVLSCIGAMFAPDQVATARELVRVCHPGGTIAMANWTPDGAASRFFATLARHAPPPPGPSPTSWGDPGAVRELLGSRVESLATARRTVRFATSASPAEITAEYRASFGPVVATRAALGDDPERIAAFDADLLRFWTEENRGPVGGPGCWAFEYLLVLARR
ncbi:MAG TPA: class I SAM-dependent methyltransferase [Pseudonocardia sp.]|nr:class I SAM-dependent methyltransferase [Pseudonocardia sp.]